MLWPVTAPPLRDGDGVLLDETIPTSTTATGRLRNILEAGRANSVVWMLDPDLLDLADKASKGYFVKASKENINGIYANEIGTDTHQWVEDYFNQIWKPIPSNLDLIHRINKFNKVFAKYLHRLEPIKFEVRIFSKKWNIAGMIDALFIYKGKIYILDYIN